jgi:hypothetical protein
MGKRTYYIDGQTRAEHAKNFKRVRDIVTKSAGDVDKKKRLARTQAKLIRVEHKAINRAMAARELGEEEIFDIFFRRAYALGEVGKKEFRDYQLSKLI